MNEITIKLAKPDLYMEQAYTDFAVEWQKNGEEIVPSSARLLGDSYSEWLEKSRRMEYKETCPAELVPATTYFLTAGERILGAINIRHTLNDYLFHFGGHIGYGVRPSERGQGYAGLMLSMALPIAGLLGISKVLITCDKLNLASAKTILHNGGVLENEVAENGKITQRYWIEVIK